MTKSGAKVLIFSEICKRKMHKIAEKDEEAELLLLVADVIKSGYNADEMDGESQYRGIAVYRNPKGMIHRFTDSHICVAKW